MNSWLLPRARHSNLLLLLLHLMLGCHASATLTASPTCLARTAGMHAVQYDAAYPNFSGLPVHFNTDSEHAHAHALQQMGFTGRRGDILTSTKAHSLTCACRSVASMTSSDQCCALASHTPMLMHTHMFRRQTQPTSMELQQATAPCCKQPQKVLSSADLGPVPSGLTFTQG